MKLVRRTASRRLEQQSTRSNRVIDHPAGRWRNEHPKSPRGNWAPAVEVHETDSEYLIEAILPEVKREDVRVDVHDGMLCLQGERKREEEETDRKFHRIARKCERFEGRILLPRAVDPRNVAAEFKDGVLRVHLPKSKDLPGQSLEVKVS
jgi:HSP20 family protein